VFKENRVFLAQIYLIGFFEPRVRTDTHDKDYRNRKKNVKKKKKKIERKK
jgi:hypothetical protein